MMAESQSAAESQEHSQEGPSSIPGKRHDTKLKLEFAERHTNREASKSFSVGESGVRDWRKANNKHTELPSKRCRQPVGGRKAQAPDREEVLTALD